MKGLLVYYSNTGNTKLACEYIKRHLANAELELVDLKHARPVDFSAYDLVGFAAWADYSGPSKLIIDYLESLPRQNGKPCFVFNTYGMFNGGTLKGLADRATRSGFKVVAAFALHTPENIPTMLSRGLTSAGAPDEKEREKFRRFIGQLEEICREIEAGRSVARRPRFGLLDYLTLFPRTRAKKEMGEQFVDQARCTKCGACKKECPYAAIDLAPYPVFDQKKCYGCWCCYNRCPQQAIYTNKFRGRWHYPQPLEEFRHKL
ncbi:MAG: EFR1 family ferrodoxin [Candidatus Margulisbacteria bacterium]|jgi:ferredoxin|nr:EFR1 family ferrodoxin [Candidatus Margulisiibacteriota bacterium]